MNYCYEIDKLYDVEDDGIIYWDEESVIIVICQSFIKTAVYVPFVYKNIRIVLDE